MVPSSKQHGNGSPKYSERASDKSSGCQTDKLPFAPAWSAIKLHGRLRRSEQKSQGLKRVLRRQTARITRQLSSILIQSAVPGATNPWFSEQEAETARHERAELLERLSGRVNISANGAKLHLGPLSPGCAICMEGYWGCNYINGRCQRNCFYCLRYHSMRAEPDCSTDGFSFKSPQEHIQYLKTFRIKGVGFSGGEPLLAFDRLVSHITAIRQEFGPGMYVWMYTNGDLVNRERLQILKNAGLNELRCDLSARGYDVTPLALAREYIPTVSVEIPAIPEDFSLLKESLEQMQAIGVNHLNLHQLLAGERNWRAYCARRYHFSIQQMPAVHESEMCALRLLLHACEQGLRVPINYCSYAYRFRYYGRTLRSRAALVAVEDQEEITEAGYIRLCSISDTAEQLQALVRRMERAQVNPKLWKVDREHGSVTLHSSLLSHVDWTSARPIIQYYAAYVTLQEPSAGFSPGNLKVTRHLVRTEQHTPTDNLSFPPSKHEKLEAGLADVV